MIKKQWNKLRHLSSVTDVYEKDNRIYVVGEDTDAIIATMFEQQIGAKDISMEQGRLDEAFESLTSAHREEIL